MTNLVRCLARFEPRLDSSASQPETDTRSARNVRSISFAVPCYLVSTMVVPLFGWSAGDIVVSVQILYRIAEAFRDAGGAKDQYAENAAWLDSFAHDLERVRDYISENPTAKYSKDVKQQIANIDPKYVEFERYLQKYDAALASTSSVGAIKRTAQKARWAVKQLKGHVDGLKVAVSGPLMSINLLLTLQSL